MTGGPSTKFQFPQKRLDLAEINSLVSEAVPNTAQANTGRTQADANHEVQLPVHRPIKPKGRSGRPATNDPNGRRIQIVLNRDVLKAVRLHAAEADSTLSVTIETIIRAYLKL